MYFFLLSDVIGLNSFYNFSQQYVINYLNNSVYTCLIYQSRYFPKKILNYCQDRFGKIPHFLGGLFLQKQILLVTFILRF